MNVNKFGFSLLCCLIIYISNAAFASNYPKSPIDKEMDNMGSIIGDKGITFAPNRAKTKVTQNTVTNVNNYLFQAAIEVLKFAPLASVDSNSGVVITDWYHPKSEQNTQFKVIVYVKEKKAKNHDGLEVVVFERKRIKNDWSPNHKSLAVAQVLENKIIKKAKDLHLQSGK